MDTSRNLLFNEIKELRNSLEDKVSKVNDRLIQIENDYHKNRDELIADIEEKNRKLVEQLNDFKKKFEEEQEYRRKQEVAMTERLAAHEQYVRDRFEKEKTDREKKISSLWLTLDSHAKGRSKNDFEMNKLITEEMAVLKNDLTSEIKLREKEDDEIVIAIQKYTQKLQTSLKIINSTDT